MLWDNPLTIVRNIHICYYKGALFKDHLVKVGKSQSKFNVF